MSLGSDRDALKQLYDFFKHLTTINTGSILLMIAMLEKLFKSPEWKWLIGASFTCFLLSLCASLFCMFFYIRRLGEAEGLGDIERNFAGASFLTSTIGFLAGLVTLAVFSLKNL